MNKKMWVIAYKIMWGIYPISGGGGGEKATVVQAPASAPAPSATETAGDIYKARLQYDPLTSAMEMQQQQQYMPQQAALYQSLFNQYAPQMARTQQQTQRELYPYQSQLVEQGAQQALQRLQNPDYMTPQEQQALEANRTKEVTSLQAAMRNRANMGGTLYGGRSAAEETRGVSDLMQQFELQDYQRRMGAGQAAQQALNPYMQILYPQVGTQQPQISQFQNNSAVNSPDALLNAIMQGRQSDSFFRPGTLGGVNLGFLGRVGGGATG